MREKTAVRFVADLHIHSHYSVATSKFLTPPHLDAWARMKGITLLGTGDAAHPGWLAELEARLVPAREDGLFVLDPAHASTDSACYVPPSCRHTPRFMLTAEVSSIYKKGGKVRKVHNLICLPSFDAARALQGELAKRGNIESDGRPILGVDSRDVLEIVLSTGGDAFLVPAHVWTPWFSVLGSKSGFDTVEECYEDLAEHVFAVETGLSSDPEMNRMCSFLDRYTLVSNSDAHSPEKLGREANIFDCPLSFTAVRDALATRRGFLGTIEFFPQEGKYHYDGHRKCGVRFDPVETLRHGGVCPSCGGKLTVGVMNRVAELADREPEEAPPDARLPFHSITSLASILSEIHERGENTRTVKNAYLSLIEKYGPEFSILLDIPVEEMERGGDRLLAEAIRRMRAREVIVEEGFDGRFGRIRIFRRGEKGTLLAGGSLFRVPGGEYLPLPGDKTVKFSLTEYKRLLAGRTGGAPSAGGDDPPAVPGVLTPEQRKAVEHYTGPCMIIAGPGTGKTFTLTSRIAHLVTVRGIDPGCILAVTFTNKAAEEMRERLARLLAGRGGGEIPLVSTLHAFGLGLCRRHAGALGRSLPLTVIGEEEKLSILRDVLGLGGTEARRAAAALSRTKRLAAEPEDPWLAALFPRYEEVLREENVLDMDDCIRLPVILLESSSETREEEAARYPWICVDEYQDLNHAQYRMIRALAPPPDANICVIGDPDQSIYGFRGADAACMRNFTGDYPRARVYRLTKSHRCTSRILEASSNVLEKDTVLEGSENGVKITIKEEETDRSEAEYIARTIERLVGGVSFFSIDSAVTNGDRDAHITGLSDFAVLFRVSRMGDLIAEAMRNHNIPYRLVGTDSRLHGHPYLDFLRLAVNPAHAAAEKRLRKEFGDSGGPGDIRTFAGTLGGLSPKKALEKIRAAYGVPPAHEETTRELLGLAGRMEGGIEAFLAAVVLGRDIDAADLRAERVSLMTMHAAKGLEFACVFVAGCEEGIIPCTLFDRAGCDMEEERRILYVAMTRARRYLYLVNAKKRTLFGRSLAAPRSRFVERIRRDLVRKEKRTTRKKGKPRYDDHLTLF